MAERAAAVGPVLRAGALTDVLVAALREVNADLSVIDRGGYLRVSAPGRLLLRRADCVATLGDAFELPAALHQAMTGYAGRLSLTDHEALWSED
ncbi:MAG: MmoB/DmpM family protein [Rhodocyclaceae bacterium]|nr:MmoB/DmpM family protein [Rhodocyclaceae bacterium]